MTRSTASHALPPNLLQRIFAMLPHHEHIVHALMTCKAWCGSALPMPHACLQWMCLLRPS